MLGLVGRSWLAHRNRIAHDNPEHAVRHAALMLAGYLREAVVFADLWPPASSIDPEAITQTLHRMVLGYLTETPR